MIKCNLAVLLAERGLKIADVFKATKISRTTLTALYYNTSAGIQFDTLDKLSDYLRVEPGDLIKYLDFSFNIIESDYQMPNLFMKIEIEIRNKKIQGESIITVSNDCDESSDKEITISIKYPDDIYNEISKLPQLFVGELETSIVDKVLNMIELHNGSRPNTYLLIVE
ncbi:helix-turn-helix transcriptional regulator [Fodinisporobacter ferrooxydans]|uniref:Helix-turn-helix transcriptional regulator n=1 Tax=Fodinisporobacter ferrooxydans TaxID=2901836 RepID=A0ABY4CSE8_9BACL|nr:helix-turn-helix transcriptional regulator [Alicyclobacillaceae bacterium MYW30-H2]